MVLKGTEKSGIPAGKCVMDTIFDDPSQRLLVLDCGASNKPVKADCSAAPQAKNFVTFPTKIANFCRVGNVLGFKAIGSSRANPLVKVLNPRGPNAFYFSFSLRSLSFLCLPCFPQTHKITALFTLLLFIMFPRGIPMTCKLIMVRTLTKNNYNNGEDCRF